MHHLDRVIADARNRPQWLAERALRLGGSDAASFARASSVDIYVRAKLRDARSTFTGNAYTRTGNQWEEAALAGAGHTPNPFLIRSVDEDGFVATPDGIRETPAGLRLAEAKAKLVRIADGEDIPAEIKIPPVHRRQMWWTQYVLGAEVTDYVVLYYDEGGTPLEMLPRVVHFERDEAEIRKLVNIGRPVLSAIRAAYDFERNLNS